MFPVSFLKAHLHQSKIYQYWGAYFASRPGLYIKHHPDTQYCFYVKSNRKVHQSLI